MDPSQTSRAEDRIESSDDAELAELAHRIDHAAHLLPAQGPIAVFVHHNTLHAYEELTFHEAVERGARRFGCQPYLSEDRFREELRTGRIRFSELQSVLREDLGEQADRPVPCFGTRFGLRLVMLQYAHRSGPTDVLQWHMAESDSLRRVRPEASAAMRAQLVAETRRWVMRDLRLWGNGSDWTGASNGLLEGLGARRGGVRIEEWGPEDWEAFSLQALWRVCCDGVGRSGKLLPVSPPRTRHRDLLLEATGEDADRLVNEVLIPFCAAFLDQGLAHWRLPRREAGFFRSFCALYRRAFGPPRAWARGLARELGELEDGRVTALRSIERSLEELGVASEEQGEYIASALLALRGWCGMIWQLEVRGDRAVNPAPPGSLRGFLAVRLILDRYAARHVARAGGIPDSVSLRELRAELVGRRDRPGLGVESRALAIFELAQVAGISADRLYPLSDSAWGELLGEVEGFGELERRRVFQLAYERRLYTQVLDALELHNRGVRRRVSRPRFQAIFCIDEREESIRRHLEEVAPDAETFGTAGYFSVAMYYKGVDDAHFVPLCPVVVVPRHWVTEEVIEGSGDGESRRKRARRAVGMARHGFHSGSRSLMAGAILSAGVGALASVPLIARTLFPRATARFRDRMARFVRPPQRTRLQIERTASEPGSGPGGRGFDIGEMTELGAKVLREIGLTDGFARLVLVIGHGSRSANNPHKSAYECGACGGSSGGPNARALAQILNEERVRERLAARGIRIPATTWFVGGMHNTTDDSMRFYDVDLIPEGLRREFAAVREIMERASEANAHERCRRFESAPLTLTPEGARQHVEARAEDLAQVRPEWGHATNAIAIVGRRGLTRGLYLDRRAFLVSYEPSEDDEELGTLAAILGAVVPVCAGINLEYYFSRVDNVGWGSGTKLPHNVTSLIGVMDGSASDLRTGLPWQMVEFHEPVRLLLVVEADAGRLARLLDRGGDVGRLCRNGWVQLAAIDPRTREIRVYEEGEFRPDRAMASVLPTASSSRDWYRGWRENLEFAEIGRRGSAAESGEGALT